jgi:selenocysteine lyase/cysteine desulfurase
MDIHQIRKDTPGVEKVIHLNNAGAALQPVQVIDKIREYQEYEFLHGGYETAELYKEEIKGTYSAIAHLINATSPEIALVENATTAWDMAFHSLEFSEGDVILTSRAEYASNFIGFLQARKRYGIEIKVVENDKEGQLDLQLLDSMITPKVKLIAINHVPTNSGLVNPAEEIGKIARENKIFYLLDACQSIGQVPIDVKRIGCHFLSATGRKYLRGPRGTGFLYVEESIIHEIEPVFLDLHSAKWVSIDEYVIRKDARRFENWECNYSLRLGLKEAAEYARSRELEGSWERIMALGSLMRNKLSSVPRVNIYDKGHILGGIVTFSVEGYKDADIKKALLSKGINVAVGPGNAALLDMQSKGINSLIRASVHYYNTEEEIDYFVKSLEAVIDES